MKHLTEQALNAINTIPIRRKISALVGKSEDQVRRYIHSNDIVLTAHSVLELIEAETGLKGKEVLTEKA